MLLCVFGDVILLTVLRALLIFIYQMCIVMVTSAVGDSL